MIYTNGNQEYFDIQGQMGSGSFLVSKRTAQSFSTITLAVAPDPSWTPVPDASSLADLSFDNKGAGIAPVDPPEDPPA